MDDRFAARRARMVSAQLVARGVCDPRVLAALGRVPRHHFIERDYEDEAYHDTPLPIAAAQTISQPYIVALMSELARVTPGSRVLEVGTGSGYQAAVLAELGAHVHSLEIVPELADSARARLATLGYEVQVHATDGFRGLPESAPFDAILITAAPPEVPAPLVEQLAVGGRLVAPVGVDHQRLIVVERTPKGVETEALLDVRFVPMTGACQP